MYKYYEEADLYDVWMSPELYNDDYRAVVPELMANYSNLPEMCYTKNAAQIFDEYVAPALDTVWIGESSVEDAVAALGESVMTVYQGVW